MTITIPHDTADAVLAHVEQPYMPVYIRAWYWLPVDPSFTWSFVLFGYGFDQWNTIIRDARVEGAENPETFVWPFAPAGGVEYTTGGGRRKKKNTPK